MVYITTTKRVKQSEKPILTFQNFDCSEFVGGGDLGGGGWGIRISRFIMCSVFGSSKIQFSEPLAKGQLSRIGG
jgi:hypothetical protein